MRATLPIKSLTLSVTLAFLLGVLVAISVLVVLAIEWVAGADITVELMDARTRLALNMLEGRLKAHLDPAREQAAFIARLVADGRLDLADRAAERQMMLGSIAGTPQILLAGVVGEDLRLVGAERQGDTIAEVDRPIRPEAVDEYRATAVRSDTAPFWAAPVYIPAARVSALNIRQRLIREGKTVGVVFTTIAITELSRFLRTLDNEPHELHAFILYGRDHVLAYGGLHKGLAYISVGHPLPSLGEIGNPVLASIWNNPRPAIARMPDVDTHVVTVDGRDWMFLLRPVTGYGPEPFNVGFFIPVDRVDHQLRLLYWSGAAGLAVLVLALLAAIGLGRALARPIRRTAEQANRIGSFELEQLQPLPGSIVRELNDQSRAFNTMLTSLRWFETYLPKTLVRRLIVRGDPAGIETTERELSIMFTDIAGFTATAEHMTPAETAAFVNHHLTLVTGCIDAEGGTVDKYIGDAVMAFWGAPEIQDDHADRACRAALAIQAAIAADNRERAGRGMKPVHVRIGIHTGAAIVGNIGSRGRMNYTVVGDAVNAAQRLEALCKEVGEVESEVAVLVSASTHSALTTPLPTREVGSFAVKGRTRKIEVYRLISA